MTNRRSTRDEDRNVRGALRASAVLTGFMLITLPLMPIQALLVAFAPSWARALPHWYHRKVCRIVGVRLHIEGEVPRDRPVLLISNHVSWLDIPVISAVAPVSFVAKKEVGGWPFVSWLARLQRSVYVDRTRRTSIGVTANAMIARLHAGDALVLFAEGTSSDGARVLPFRTSLFAAAKPTTVAEAAPPDAVVQTLALAYTHIHGLPLRRADRHMIGWYGDMEMGGHAWALLKSGPIDVRIRLGAPVPLHEFADRKALARHTEHQIRASVVELLRGRPVVVPAPPADPNGSGAATTRAPASVDRDESPLAPDSRV